LPSNLITALGSGTDPGNPDDHSARIDSRADPYDEARGLSVRPWENPALVEVTYALPGGSRARYWLNDCGERLAEPPDGADQAGTPKQGAPTPP
jgi:hypothetical protein